MKAPVYGVMAEFETPGELVRATRAAVAKGYKKVDAYSPFPIEEVADALHLHRNKLPLIVLGGGLAGGTLGYLLQYFITVIYYPINIGGRPLHSWPSYIIITFELTILLASISAVFGMFALCGLPMPYHPVFNAPRFALASNDRFFLCIESTDPLFDSAKTSEFLATLDPKEVSEVAH
jgi:Protein of unknown function (DUF3341)